MTSEEFCQNQSKHYTSREVNHPHRQTFNPSRRHAIQRCDNPIKMSHISWRQLATSVDVHPFTTHAIRRRENLVKSSLNVTHLATSTTYIGRNLTSYDIMQSNVGRTLSKRVKTSHISRCQPPTLPEVRLLRRHVNLRRENFVTIFFMFPIANASKECRPKVDHS